FCSVSTARRLLNFPPDQTVYLLARCRSRHDAPAVVERLRERGYDDMSVFTAEEFSLHSRLHWLLKTKAGGALGYAALLGLMVGAVVAYQTLESATGAAVREYATLLALGIPRWRLALTVVAQSFWVGVAGVALALPAVFALATTIDRLGGIPVKLPGELLAAA